MLSLAITLVLLTLMSRLCLWLTWSRQYTSSCSSASEVANRMTSSAYRRFVSIRPPICSPPWNPSRLSLITSARMLNKYGERTQPCWTPFLTLNHYGSVRATLTLTSCFPYSFTGKSIKCSGYTHVHSDPKLIMGDRVEYLLEVHKAHYRVVAGACVPCASVFWNLWFGLLSPFRVGIPLVLVQFLFPSSLGSFPVWSEEGFCLHVRRAIVL